MDYELIKPDKDDAYDPAPFLSYARARSADKEGRDADVGDIVHFWDDEAAECQAALVVRVKWDLDCEADPDGQYWLRVSTVEGERTQPCVLHGERKSSNTWHWPCGGH